MAGGLYTDLWQREAVLKMFDQQNTPLYEVYQSKEKKFDSADHADDIIEARDFLDQQLQAIEHFGNPSTFKILFYRCLTEKGKFAVENLKGSNTFKLSEHGEAAPGSYWGERRKMIGGANGSGELAEIKDLLKGMQSQINALQQDPDEDQAEGKSVSGLSAVMGMLAGIMNNPEVQAVIAAKAIGFINKIVPDATGRSLTMQTAPVLGELSPKEIEDLNAAILKLIAAGMSINDFVKLAAAADNKGQFDMYLKLLRGG